MCSIFEPGSRNVVGSLSFLFKMFKGTLGSCTLGYTVISADAFKRAFTEHLHSNPHPPSVSQLLRFPKPQIQYNTFIAHRLKYIFHTNHKKCTKTFSK